MSDQVNTGGEAKQGSFDALLAEISGDLAKAYTGDDAAKEDAKIAAAAADGDGDGDEDDDEKPEMAKSFKITLDDGTEIDAVDGAGLVKSLVERVEKNETGVGELLKAQTKAITSLGDLVKSLRTEVADLKGQGKGRKAVLTVAEKPAPKTEDLAKSEPDGGVSGEEFLAKALSAQAAGRISGTDVAVAEMSINAGRAPPAHIVRAVLAE